MLTCLIFAFQQALIINKECRKSEKIPSHKTFVLQNATPVKELAYKNELFFILRPLNLSINFNQPIYELICQKTHECSAW
jgi:hypothetical protein